MEINIVNPRHRRYGRRVSQNSVPSDGTRYIKIETTVVSVKKLIKRSTNWGWWGGCHTLILVSDDRWQIFLSSPLVGRFDFRHGGGDEKTLECVLDESVSCKVVAGQKKRQKAKSEGSYWRGSSGCEHSALWRSNNTAAWEHTLHLQTQVTRRFHNVTVTDGNCSSHCSSRFALLYCSW